VSSVKGEMSPLGSRAAALIGFKALLSDLMLAVF
jgi:hypothetical protein